MHIPRLKTIRAIGIGVFFMEKEVEGDGKKCGSNLRLIHSLIARVIKYCGINFDRHQVIY